MTTIAQQLRPSNTVPRNALCVAVAPGAPIPGVGDTIMADSPLSDLAYRVSIKSIARIEWIYDSRFRDQVVGIRVWVRGEKEVVAR